MRPLFSCLVPLRPGSTDPSPRTAKLIMYERMLDWHVDTVCLAPETCRLTHHASGMSFELREVRRRIPAALPSPGHLAERKHLAMPYACSVRT